MTLHARASVLGAHPLELVSTLVVVDQASKLIASRLPLARPFPLLPGVLDVGPRSVSEVVALPPWASILLGAAAVALATQIWPRVHATGPRLGAILVLAGSIGNLVDRALLGGGGAWLHLQVGQRLSWSGNLADLWVTAGVFLLARALLVGSSLRGQRTPGTGSPPPAPPEPPE